jgi:LmbE family N-acetylglucosaminyl deacetylase
MVVVAVAAHPDDETAFAGGLLARYAAEGHNVYIILTTRGEGGEMGEPALCERSELGAWREREAREAAAALGARAVFFLPFCDPVVGPDNTLYHIDASLDDFSTAIAELLRELAPDVVITHGSAGEYGHPQHKFTHAAVFAALEMLRPWRSREILTWAAAYPEPEMERMINKDDPADLVVDVRPWLAQKIAAYQAHRTQHALFFRHNEGKTLDQIPLRIESFRRWP